LAFPFRLVFQNLMADLVLQRTPIDGVAAEIYRSAQPPFQLGFDAANREIIASLHARKINKIVLLRQTTSSGDV
jgi:hypothetical protein